MSLEELPIEALKELFIQFTPSELLKLTLIKKELTPILNDRYYLSEMSHKYGIPLSTTLKQLIYYYNMTPKKLFKNAIKINDLRVAKYQFNAKLVTINLVDIAVLNNNFDMVKLLLTNVDDKDKKYICVDAIESSILNEFSDILDYFITNNCIDYHKLFIYIASYIGNIDNFKKLIEYAKRNNIYDYIDSDALKNACQKSNNTNIIEYMLSIKVPVNVNALTNAIDNNNNDIVTLLLNNKYYYNTAINNNLKNDIIYDACRNKNLSILENILVFDNFEDYLDSRCITGACSKNNTRIMHFLLYVKKIVPNNEAILQACKYGYIEIVELLLKYIYDYNRTEEDINNMINADAILYACQNKFYYIVKKMLEYKVPFNMYAIDYAADNNDINIIKLFLNLTPRILSSDIHSDSIKYACERGNYDMVKLLINYGVKFENDAFLLATFSSDEKEQLKIIKLLIKYSNNLHLTEETLLEMPCINGFLHIIKILRNYDAVFTETCISNAIINNNYKVAKFILKEGLIIPQRALYIASVANNLRMVKLLLKYGAQYTIDAINDTDNEFIKDLLIYSNIKYKRYNKSEHKTMMSSGFFA